MFTDTPAETWRQQRMRVHLAALHEPLSGVELHSRDQAVLAQWADQDAETVGAIVH